MIKSKGKYLFEKIIVISTKNTIKFSSKWKHGIFNKSIFSNMYLRLLLFVQLFITKMFSQVLDFKQQLLKHLRDKIKR